MRIGKRIESTLLLVAATMLGLMICLSARAADCGCNFKCSALNYTCIQNCQAYCDQNAEIAKSRSELKATLNKDKQTLLPAFQKARDKLWETDPKSPSFLKTFQSYKALRVKRDQALILEYVAVAGLGSLFGNGSEFRVLDEEYMVPPNARTAFHDYAMAQLKGGLNAGPRAFGARPDGYAGMDEFGGGKGSYFGYTKLADEAELSVWAAAHGSVPTKIGITGFPAPTGMPKTLDELTPEELAQVKECGEKTKAQYPNARYTGEEEKQMTAFYRACTHKTK